MRGRRWRPSLWQVLGGGLAGTLALSFAGLVALRYLGPGIGFRNAAILLASGITLATGVLGWLLVRLLLRPIHALESYAAGQERGERVPKPAHYGTQELHNTALRVISMAEALRDREATIRAYTDHVTHEIRTPVSVIRAATELLEDGDDLSAEDRKLLAQIDSARAQIEDQLAALRRAALARETRYLGQTTVLEALGEEQTPSLDLTVLTAGDETIPIAKEGLKILFGQLFRNAEEHGATAVSIAVSRQEGVVMLDVHDNGTGVSAGNAEHIFEPFFTTRRDEGGSGMGLAIVRNMMRAHGGDIRLLASQTGCAFRLSFDVSP